MEWEKIPKEVCQNLIESMPRRVQAVMRLKEGIPSTNLIEKFGQQWNDK